MTRLDELTFGRRARIGSIGGADALSQRLQEMGLLEGDEIELVAVAPLGDPLEFKTASGLLSLRRAEARRVIIEPLPGA